MAKRNGSNQQSRTETDPTKDETTQPAATETETTTSTETENTAAPEDTAPAQDTNTSEDTTPPAPEAETPTVQDTPTVTADQDQETPAEEEPVAEVDTATVAGRVSAGIDEYAAVMGPNAPVDTAKIGRSQLQLRSLINTVMGAEDQEFSEGMKALITGIRKYRKGAFAENFVFRGFESMRIAAGERKRLESLITLFLAAVDAANPKKVGEAVDMTALFRNGISNDDEQQKLQAYFKG